MPIQIKGRGAKKHITARQRAARRKNIAVARAARHKGKSISGGWGEGTLLKQNKGFNVTPRARKNIIHRLNGAFGMPKIPMK